MRSVLLLALTIALSRPTEVRGRRHEYSAHLEYPKRARGVSRGATSPEVQNNTEVVVQLGGTASIKCYTHFIGDETVTWLKREEDQLLTAGGQVYSSETRYSVSHVRHQQLWELSVRDVKKSDAGVYECQLTTHPPTSLFFRLKVVEALAVLQGGPDIHVQTGASLRLHCVLHHATETPEFIFWYHNGSMINYAPRRPLKVVKHHYSTALVIADVRWDDAGSYTCEPHMARSANLTLHVVAGEKPAALQNGQGEGDENSSSAPATTTTGVAFCLVLLLLRHFYENVAEAPRCDYATLTMKNHKKKEEEEEDKEESKRTNIHQKQEEDNGVTGEERRIVERGEKLEDNWRYS